MAELGVTTVGFNFLRDTLAESQESMERFAESGDATCELSATTTRLNVGAVGSRRTRGLWLPTPRAPLWCDNPRR